MKPEYYDGHRKFITLPRWHHFRNDLSDHKTFGTVLIENIPKELDLTWPPILNQGTEPSCTGHTAVITRGRVKQKHYDPHAFYQDEKEMLGNPNAQGADLDTQGAVGVKIGFTPTDSSTPTDRADATFTITPSRGYDIFDSVRSALAQRLIPISAGLQWYQSWDHPEGGVIPNEDSAYLGAHNSGLMGMTVKNGEDTIIIQGSWGEGYGDKGKFYLNRAKANKVLRYGLKYWLDGLPPDAKKLGFLAALLQNLLNLLIQLAPGVARALGLQKK